MSKRKCIFNDNLKKKYSFLRITYDDSNVRCNKCNATFSVAAGGDNDIENHFKTKKHKVAANVSLQASIISDFLNRRETRFESIDDGSCVGVPFNSKNH